MRELLGTVVRQWYVILGCALLAGGLHLVAMSRPDVYSGRVTVAVLAPPTVDRSTLQRPDAVLLASLAVIEVNGAPHRLVSNVSGTTLHGRGTTRGTVIRMQHGGNQWKPDAPRPYVLIEAVDLDPAAVERRLEVAFSRLTRQVRDIEARYGVEGDQRVEIVRFAAGGVVWVPTSPSRSLAASGLVGAVLALWAVPVVERRSRRRAGRPPAGPTTP